MSTTYNNYEELLKLWETSLEFVKETDMRARIIGVRSYMKTFDFLIGILLGELILRHSDNLSRTLQSPKISAAEAQKVVAMTVKTLESLREEEMFKLFWTNTLRKSRELSVNEPELPRKRKTPRRYEVGESEGDFLADEETHYRVIYYAALDQVISSIKARIEQPGYQVYSHLESLLLNAMNKVDYIEHFEFIIGYYGEDFNSDQLKLQLSILAGNIPVKETKYSLNDCIDYMKSLSEVQKTLLSEVVTLLSLSLVMPATNAISERSFSSLRRIKNYSRSTMSQVRLNNIIVLHVHKDKTDNLSSIQAANDFLQGSTHRQQIFGQFVDSDYV